MSYTKSKEPHAIPVTLPALTANTTRSSGSVLQNVGEIIAVSVAEMGANITGDNTNRYSFAFNKGTIASPTTLATLDLVTGTNLVVSVPQAATMNTTATTRRVTTTDVLHVVATKNGSASNTTGPMEVVFWMIPVYDHAGE